MYNFDPYSVFLAIATNIPVLLMTAFVLQGHKYYSIYNTLLMNATEYCSSNYSELINCNKYCSIL